MAKTPSTAPPRDPFGATLREGLARRFAGAGLATLLVVSALAWWVPLIPLIACAAIYVFGVPLSLAIEQRWPTPEGRSPVPRYVGLGAAVGIGLAFGLAIPSAASGGGISGWVLVFSAFTVPLGAIAGGVTAWGARSIPERWLVPSAIGGVIAAIVITATMAILTGGS
jgi:hypothetical protein